MKEAKAALEAEQRAKDGPDEDPEPSRRGPKRKLIGDCSSAPPRRGKQTRASKAGAVLQSSG
jgi:hypothetical protein